MSFMVNLWCRCLSISTSFGSNVNAGKNKVAKSIFWSLACGGTGNSAPTPSLTINLAFGVNSTVTNLGKKNSKSL